MSNNIVKVSNKINGMQNFEIYKKLESESTTMEEKARRLVVLFYALVVFVIGFIYSLYTIILK